MDLNEADIWLGENGYEFVRFTQTDLHGMTRSKTVPVRHFRRFAENGLNFFGGLLGLDIQAGVAMGTGYMDERNFADQLAWPDLGTLSPVPWIDGTARVLCEPAWYSGEPAQAGPRWLMRQMLERLEGMGYIVRAGFEYEFYIIDALSRLPVFDGIEIFWTLHNEFNPEFVSQSLQWLFESGIDIITSNSEYGPGQMEINYAPADGMRAADDAFTFRNGMKEISQIFDYVSSFMTKPWADQSASGCHYHHTLLHKDTGENAFFDASRPDGLSDLCRHFLAGQLAHSEALCALLAPTINDAKRFKLFSFAPMNVTWGFEDRTAAVRVKGRRQQDTHLENRIPCAASNPYLVAAGVLAAGLDGIERGLEPPLPTEQIAYADESATKLPQTLDASLQALEADTELQGYLGGEFVKLFLAVKRHEIEKAKAAIPEYGSEEWPNIVTDWERENLFDYL
jgi:glutamine synthetase